MKPYTYITILLFSGMLFSCSDDDGKNSGNDANIAEAKVINYLVEPQNSDAYVVDLNYSENGNRTELTYANANLIEYVNEAAGYYPNGDPKSYTQFILGSNNLVTSIITKTHEYYSFQYTINYNSNNQINDATTYKTHINGTGNPSSEPILYQVDEFTWESENLVKWNSAYYDNDGAFDYEIDQIFSGFLPENINTIGAKNFGFDFFGKGGIPVDFLDTTIHPFKEKMFAGKLLPTQIVRQILNSGEPDSVTDYTFTKDAKGRVKECRTEQELNLLEKINYTYKN